MPSSQPFCQPFNIIDMLRNGVTWCYLRCDLKWNARSRIQTLSLYEDALEISRLEKFEIHPGEILIILFADGISYFQNRYVIYSTK